jgi:hypothetical protein
MQLKANNLSVRVESRYQDGQEIIQYDQEIIGEEE